MDRPQRSFRAIAMAVLALLGACSGLSREPRFAAVTVAPVPADKARIYFYRFYEPYESLAQSPIYLNRVEAAVSVPGEVEKRDVPPGAYEIYVYSRADFPGQFKQAVLRPGDTLYVRVDAFRGQAGTCQVEWATLIATLVPAEQAQSEMAGLRYGEDHGS